MSKKKATQDHAPPELTCAGCNAMCCRYVATGIDTPTCKRDYDHIRWYLLHDNVFVFVDHEGDWYIEFAADCAQLGADGLCQNYSNRPRLCRTYGEDGAHCEFHSHENPYRTRFCTPGEFEAYLQARGIPWRWTTRDPQRRPRT